MKYVITGGPGVGKTTTIEMISALGHATIDEAARDIIAEEQQKEHGILPWTDLYRFQQITLMTQLGREWKAPDFAFADRGIVDSLAYCRNGTIAPPPELTDLIPEHQYGGVFLLEPLPVHVTDGVRVESQEEALTLQYLIKAVYEEVGYDVIKVPVMTPQERADFIIGQALKMEEQYVTR
jgi:predicted ATPase